MLKIGVFLCALWCSFSSAFGATISVPAVGTYMGGTCAEWSPLTVLNTSGPTIGCPDPVTMGTPSVSACGTGCALSTTSTDKEGQIVLGSSLGVLSAPVLTFSKPMPVGWQCAASGVSAVSVGSAPSSYTVAVTSVTFNILLSSAGGRLFYTCGVK